jgi:hypothetical protein
VSQTWFRGQFGMQLKFYRSNCSTSHHHVLRWDWHFRSTLWYHKTRLSHPNYPHLSQGRNQCRRRGSNIGTCSSNSTVPIVPPPPLCAAVGLALQIHPLVPKTRLPHPNYPHHPRDASSVADVVRGQFGTYSSNSTVPIVPPPPPCAAVGLFQIHPLVP